MEAEICCAYNATRGCRLSSKVTVADSEREPLKVLKILIEGLARDSESSLWLTPLLHAPHLARLFPFDIVYLDREHRVIEGAALRPGVQIPQFTDHQTASALILPLDTLTSTDSQPGDQIIVCAEEELEARIAEFSVPTVDASVTLFADTPSAETSLPFPGLPKLPPHPLQGLRVSAPTLTASVPQGSGFTASMSTSWRISSSTTATALLEPVESREQEAASGNLAVRETDVADAESRDAHEELATFTISGVASDAAPAAEVAESSREEHPASPCDVTELDTVAAAPEPDIAEPEPDAVVAVTETLAPAALEKKLESAGEIEKASLETVPVVERARVQPDAQETGAKALAPQRKKAAEKLSATAGTSAADPVTTKRKSREAKKKASLGVLVKRFLNCEDPLPERRSIIRLLAEGLVADTGNGEKTKPHEVRDVSPTGLCLRAEEQWRQGDIVSLVLKRKGAAEEDHERRVRVEARVVRCDEGEVGLSWLWPEGVEFEPWKRVHTKRSDETDADYFLRELRLATALGFLRQICPDSADEIKVAFHQRLSNKRVASAVEITLKGQEMLRQREGTGQLAHPETVRRIIENGSWTEDDWIRQWWAGLLVSSCSAETPDTSNAVLVDMLAKLMPVHLRLLSFVCRKATELIEAGAPAATLDIYCTSQELIEAVGSHTLARIQQTMGHLSVLGLLAESNKPSYIAVTDKVKTKTVPTSLGLTMYARCHGRQ
jgi:hypothetical protein